MAVTYIVLLQVDAMMAHHATLIRLIQGSIITNNLNIPTTSIAEIINMLWIESAL